MDSPECARVSSITRSRRGSWLTTEGMSDDGWSLLDTARESLQYIVRTTSVFKLCFDDKIGLLFTGRRFLGHSCRINLLHLLLTTLRTSIPTLSWKAMAGTPPETHPLELPMCIRLWRAGLGSKDKACLQAQQLMMHWEMHVHTLQIIVLYPFMALESSGLSIGSFTLAEVAPWKSSLIDNSPQLCVPSGRSCAATKSCFVLLDEKLFRFTELCAQSHLVQ